MRTMKSRKIYRYIKCIWKSVELIVLSACVGTILLCVVSQIPQAAIFENTRTSVRLLCSEGIGSDVLSIKGSTLDIYTDGLMINMAYTSAGSLKGTLLASTMQGETEDALAPIHEYLEGASDEKETWNYTRYWHGYQIFLKPLLVIMSLTKIRALNMVLQLSLVFLVLYLCLRERNNASGLNLAIPFAVFWVTMSPIAIASSIQFYSVFYPTLFAVIVLLLQKNNSFYKTWYIFLFTGILVGYFDLLTFPLVSLAVPLIFFFCHENGVCKRFFRQIGECISFSISWCMGYAGMLVLRWAIASAVSGTNVFREGMNQILYRTAHEYSGTEYSLLSTIKTNLADACNPLTFFAVCAGLVVVAVNFKKRVKKLNIPLMIILLVVSAYPFVWFFVVMQHSNMHHWMTYRNLCITIYGIMSLLYTNFRCGIESEL